MGQRTDGSKRLSLPALVPEDCTASYFPEFKRVALEMVKAQGGIFGWVSNSQNVIKGLEEAGTK